MIDVVGFVLILLIVIPGKALARAFGGTMRWRLVLVAVFVLGVGLTATFVDPSKRTMVPLMLPAAILGVVLAFIEFVYRWNHRPKSLDGGLAWGAVAVAWTLPTLADATPERGGYTAFWALDMFDKFFFGLVGPVLDALHLRAGTGAALQQFSGVLVFISDNRIGILVAGNLILAALVYEMMRAKVRNLAPRLSHLEGRIPWPFALLWPIGQAYELWFGPHPVWKLTQQVGLAVVGLSGLWSMYLLSGGTRTLRAVFWASGVITVLHPQLLWVPCSLGFLNAFLGWTGFVQRYTQIYEQARPRLERGLVALRAYTRPVPILAGLVLTTVPRCYLENHSGPSMLGPPSSSSKLTAEPASDMVRVAWDQGSFDVDRYEFPNRLGELPWTGRTPRQAERACADRGERLCTRQEWYWGCSDRGLNQYLFPAPSKPEAIERVQTECSTDGKNGLVPSGAMSGCVNALGIHDMPGNVFEWVTVPEQPLLYGLVGSYHAYGDDLTISCPFAIVLHESQVPILDLDVIGFRCCK